MMKFVYKYPPLLSGILIRRYKRFFAEVELESGEVVTTHCANTGPMTGVCVPGARVCVSYTDNPKRKLAYTWELIDLGESEPVWVGVNTGLPNRVIKLALEEKLFPELGFYSQVKGEVAYGVDKKSRVDFLLLGNDVDRPIYLEVKNTTLASGSLALFPDTVTERGQKHLRELMALLPHSRGVMLYFINRGDCKEFSPGDAFDRVYGELLREGIKRGLEVLPCRFDVSPEGVKFLGLAQLVV